MRLIEYRNAMGWSQAALAERLACSQGMVSQIENGETNPSLALAVKIERLSGGKVPCAELLPHTEAAE